MDYKTIEKIRNLSASPTERNFIVKYEEEFFSIGGSRVSFELHVPNTILYWTDRIPVGLFEAVRDDAMKASFETAKEETRKMINKYFSVKYEKTYRDDGKETTDCEIYTEQLKGIKAQTFEAVIEKLKNAIEDMKKEEDGKGVEE